MAYTPLINEYDGFLLILVIIAAVSSIIAFVIIRTFVYNDTDDPKEEITSIVLAFIFALSFGSGGGWLFAHSPNKAHNMKAIESNVEAKYDVLVSNLALDKKDDEAALYSAAVVSNKDNSAHGVTIHITPEGVPTILSSASFDPEATKR